MTHRFYCHLFVTFKQRYIKQNNIIYGPGAKKWMYMFKVIPGAPNDNFRKNICSEDDLRSRIFGTFVVKFLVCLPLLGFSNI